MKFYGFYTSTAARFIPPAVYLLVIASVMLMAAHLSAKDPSSVFQFSFCLVAQILSVFIVELSAHSRNAIFQKLLEQHTADFQIEEMYSMEIERAKTMGRAVLQTWVGSNGQAS